MEPAVEPDHAASLVEILQGATRGSHESDTNEDRDAEHDPDIELALLLVKLSEASTEQELAEALEGLARDARSHSR